MHRENFFRGLPWAGWGFGLILLFMAGCGVKETTRQTTPEKILQAKTATPEELYSLVKRMGSEVDSLRCDSLTLDAQGGSVESQSIEKYRSAPGYIFVARPKRVRLKILVPVAKNTLFDMASDGQVFQIWYPRENKFFTGPTSIRQIRYEGVEKNPLSKFRPQHLVDALLFEKLSDDSADKNYFIYEEIDRQAKYYVLGFVAPRPGDRSLSLIRRIWIERSELRITRQQYYEPDGSVLSDITYRDYVPAGGLDYPSTVRLERPSDKYSITLSLKSFKLNVPLASDTFIMSKPPTADLVEVKPDDMAGRLKP